MDISSKSTVTISQNSPESETESIVAKLWSKSQISSSNLNQNHTTGGGDKQAFRRKLNQAIEYYCETASLNLNSDLVPSDLKKLIVGQGFPIEALGLFLELKKVSVSNSTTGGVTKGTRQTGEKDFGGIKKSGQTLAVNPQRLSDLSRKLVEYWMTFDSCAEALTSLSLGEEVSSIFAETTNFQRILFALPDSFNFSSSEFLKYLLTQCYLSIASISYGVKNGYSGKIRSQAVSSLLDRICMRYHSDADHFYGETINNPFVEFINDFAQLCQENFIARRLFAKVLLGLGSHTGGKIAKTIFLVGHQESCAAFTLLHPPEEFLEKSQTWKHILRSSIPLKTATKSKQFWTNWAHFIDSSVVSTNTSEVWKTCVSNWQSLCNSPVVNNDILIPATYALIALGREIKIHHGDKTATIMLEAMKVFDSVAKCLDSTIEEKKACGMALAQVMGDLHTFPKSKEDSSVEDRKQKLEFSSSNPIFHELIEFYENNGYIPPVNCLIQSVQGINLNQTKKVQVLDSDDEIEDDNQDEEPTNKTDSDEYIYSGEDAIEVFKSFGEHQEEFPIDERIQTLRSRNVKFPSYFSEILEVLVEGGGQTTKLESETEALKYMAIMRIPVLLSVGIRIDANMAKTLTRCLIEFESGTVLEIPIIFSFLEISTLYPFEVFDLLAHSSFDKEHYTSGQRMILLRRYSEVIQLHSKEKCFCCYVASMTINRIELASLCPEFILKYYDIKRNTRLCLVCIKNPNHLTKLQDQAPQNSRLFEKVVEVNDQQPLTWREIVDRRIQAKSRYFGSSKRKSPIVVSDTYSTKVVPLAWASLANRLISQINFFMDPVEKEIRGAANDMLLAQMFRLLGRILLGTGGSCPHLGAISAQVGELVRVFISHPDPHVRQSVISLLAIVISITDGASYIIEAVSSGQNIFESLKFLREKETFGENKALLDHTLAFVIQAASLDYRLNFDISSSENDVPNSLRILRDNL